MIEHDWLNATDPQTMLEFLGKRPSKRRLRLFAVACCESVLHWLDDEPASTAVTVAQRFADGLATSEELAAAYAAAEAAFYDTAGRAGRGDPSFQSDSVPAYFAT
jgi:hypothetical protein